MSIPWREASSLILAAKVASDATGDVSTPDYRILVTRRSGKSSYLANSYCFPGGHLDLADFDSDWWSVFADNNFSRGDLRCLLRPEGVPRPPILTNPVILQSESKAKDFLWPEIALRITAIRETFEETGILLACPSKGSTDIPVINNINDWQKRVHIDANVFCDLFRTYNIVPDVWSLKEWWNWLTPAIPGHKRFDTMFYVCCLDSMPDYNSDDNEVSLISWLTPQQVLQEHFDSNCQLAPPQVYELSRIRNFNSLNGLKEFASGRESLGIERWCASVTGLDDGALFALPGDECFGITLNTDTSDLPTLTQMRRKSMNRMELRVPICIPVFQNVILNCGHIPPKSTSDLRTSSPEDQQETQDFTSSVRISSNL